MRAADKMFGQICRYMACRTVPNRRWCSDQRGATPGSQEVVLIHRKASSRSRENEIIWRPVAKLIHFDRCQVVARFLKSRENNGNSSKRIILDRKIHSWSDPTVGA